MVMRASRVSATASGLDDTLVAVDRFIQATRDSGYRGTCSAIAELVDNALQAKATQVLILVQPETEGESGYLRVELVDNGQGMDAVTLQQALRFGGSTRFNDRKGLGRYGMGLPNSSVSQARRVDICSWRSPSSAVAAYLDVDEIAGGSTTRVPRPVRVAPPIPFAGRLFHSGTRVVWSRCDRLDHRRPRTIARKLRAFLGRAFRYFLWDGFKIEVNGEPVQSVDPLFLHECSISRGGRPFGTPLEYDIRLPRSDGKVAGAGRVTVTFSQLPVEAWHQLSNDDKNRMGISKAAGVSVVRARREIEYGWVFMGSKRKENYDDWWRCEIRFEPELDELFGVTYTKQGINPTHALRTILTPHIEVIARSLNSQVRRAFAGVRRDSTACPYAVGRAERRDHLLEPPQRSGRVRRSSQTRCGGVTYRVEKKALDGPDFYLPVYESGQIQLILNTLHPFHTAAYGSRKANPEIIELLLLAAARAEARLRSRVEREAIRKYREHWSNALAAFVA